MPPTLEKVGTITAQDQVIDIVLARKTSEHGNQYWQISNETLQAIKNQIFQPIPQSLISTRSSRCKIK
nr:hypothetical protein [Psychrobacter sp. PraFG1]UNK04770.1 hypothetical protein MN210_11230 [Psychrobacter sp. PraFG1]